MAIPIRADHDFESASRILNLPAPVADAEPARKVDLDGIAAGIAWKDSARAASTANVNLAAPGATIDGVTLTTGDRILLKDQTASDENGIYVWNGAATPATRSTDADTTDALETAVIAVEEGTNGGSTWRQTEVNFTLEVGDILWTSFGASVPDATESVKGKAELATQGETDAGTDDTRIVTPLKLKTSSLRGRGKLTTIGDGASTQYDVSHNWATFALQAEVWELTGSRKKVDVEISQPDNNTVRVNFASAPASSSHEVRLREVPAS